MKRNRNHQRCGGFRHRGGNAILAQGTLCALAAHLRRPWPGSTLLLRRHASLQSLATEEPHVATRRAQVGGPKLNHSATPSLPEPLPFPFQNSKQAVFAFPRWHNSY